MNKKLIAAVFGLGMGLSALSTSVVADASGSVCTNACETRFFQCSPFAGYDCGKALVDCLTACQS